MIDHSLLIPVDDSIKCNEIEKLILKESGLNIDLRNDQYIPQYSERRIDID